MGDPAISARLQELYQKIPAMECKPGCFDCCNYIQWMPEEWERLDDPRQPDAGYCPYASEKGCAVHSHRPFLCRIYGTVNDPRLQCPHGCRPAALLSREQGFALISEYLSLYNRQNKNRAAP